MSVSDLIIGIQFVVGLGAMFVFAALAAYYSFAIGLATKDPVYRRRASWTGLFTITLLALVLSLFIFGGTPAQAPIESQVLIFLYFIIFAFWIDSTIRAAIEEDFFHRNTFHWSVLRYPFLLCFGILVPLSFLGGQSPLNTNLLLSLSVPVFALSLAFTVIGVVTLLLTGTRSKYKSTRNFLKWLGFATLSGVLSFTIPSTIPVAVLAFCLFKMARSLTSIGKMNERSTDANPIES